MYDINKCKNMTTKELIEACEKQKEFNAFLSCLAGVIFICFIIILWATVASAGEIKVDMYKIAMIESSGNPLAHNKKDDSRGLYQITPICLKEYNNFHLKGQYTMDDLWNASVSTIIADWYINVRIPQMLKHFNAPDTIENRIIAFNAGIYYVAQNKPLPKITKDYIKKYNKQNASKHNK